MASGSTNNQTGEAWAPNGLAVSQNPECRRARWNQLLTPGSAWLEPGSLSAPRDPRPLSLSLRSSSTSSLVQPVSTTMTLQPSVAANGCVRCAPRADITTRAVRQPRCRVVWRGYGEVVDGRVSATGRTPVAARTSSRCSRVPSTLGCHGVRLGCSLCRQPRASPHSAQGRPTEEGRAKPTG